MTRAPAMPFSPQPLRAGRHLGYFPTRRGAIRTDIPPAAPPLHHHTGGENRTSPPHTLHDGPESTPQHIEPPTPRHSHTPFSRAKTRETGGGETRERARLTSPRMLGKGGGGHATHAARTDPHTSRTPLPTITSHGDGFEGTHERREDLRQATHVLHCVLSRENVDHRPTLVTDHHIEKHLAPVAVDSDHKVAVPARRIDRITRERRALPPHRRRQLLHAHRVHHVHSPAFACPKEQAGEHGPDHSRRSSHVRSINIGTTGARGAASS